MAMVGGTERTAAGRPTRGGPRPSPASPGCARCRRRTSTVVPRRSSRCRSTCAGWPTRSSRPAAHHPDGARRAAGPGRGGGQRQRPRRAADRVRPRGVPGARPGGPRRAVRSRPVVAFDGAGPTYVVPRSKDAAGGTDEEGEWSRTPDPATAARILERASLLVPGSTWRRHGCCGTGWACVPPAAAPGGGALRGRPGRALLRARRRRGHALLGLPTRCTVPRRPRLRQRGRSSVLLRAPSARSYGRRPAEVRTGGCSGRPCRAAS